MRATEVPLPQLVEPPDSPLPGDRALIGSGFAVTLGPGLVAGGMLLQRVFEQLEAVLCETFAAAGAVRASLPASEGEALLNLALHAGPLGAGRPRGLFALGTGFREESRSEAGLGGLALYRRLDVVRLVQAGAGDSPAAALLADLRRALASLGTSCSELSAQGDAHDLDLSWGERGVGRVFERALGEGDDAPRAGLLGLDLHALLAAVADVHLDREGFTWPASLAPFEVGILPGASDDQLSRTRATKLHDALQRAGVSVLLDDRDQRPADARRALRAWGLPAAVLFGPGLPEDQVLLELRSGGAPAPVPEAELLTRLGLSERAPTRRRSNATRANY
ncbi:MAG: hypothetical protein DHS20C15_22770 [Planctomycetota bacterium]|nr:MAG: hypothetical protein DHS20C15_22770 [Planctomycetota bacterium]